MLNGNYVTRCFIYSKKRIYKDFVNSSTMSYGNAFFIFDLCATMEKVDIFNEKNYFAADAENDPENKIFKKFFIDTITMQNKIHEYFSRKESEWEILSYLDESGIESFDQSIDVYIKSLINIIASEQQGKKSGKARILLKMYKEASKFFWLEMLKETKWRDRGLLGSYHSRLHAEPQNRYEAK
ncbi:hypothetical protein C2G38_2291966 [Gigaspora rosea]|uniref:Uncharacterized protein n=1 Tax=Gigaspora rosea TaxID=44941 RepID=A0A397TVV6_9GLOM|nr:hypothetical protein C2G38_2291966 [Gigaspora rosea]